MTQRDPSSARDPSEGASFSDAIARFVELERQGNAPAIDVYAAQVAGDDAALEDLLRTCLRALARVTPNTAREPRLPMVFGEFTLVREIGRGGMGVVYEAEQRSPARAVALKIIAPAGQGHADLLARFHREVTITGRLDHPNLVPIFQAGEVAGVPFYSMPLLRGEPLDVVLEKMRTRRDPAPASHARELAAWVARFVAVARGIHAAHEAGVLHRDLKPSNLFLDDAGQLHVLDFGLAREVGMKALTLTDATIGTPRYMSPEQVLSRPLDARSDVFSLGATFYELLTLTPAFRGGNRESIFRAILAIDPEHPHAIDPRIPIDLGSVLVKSLEKSPRHRYATAAEFADDLQRFLDWQPVRARPVGVAGRVVRRARRNPAAAMAAVVALLGIVAAALGPWLTARRARDDQARASAQRVLDLVASARAHELKAAELDAQLAKLEPEIAAHRARINPWDSLHAKGPLLDREQERLQWITSRERSVDEALLDLQFALQERGDQPETRARMADLVVAEALAAQSPARAERFDLLVAAYAPERLPEVRAGGSLQLHSDPPGATVYLFRYEEKDLRSIPVPFTPTRGAKPDYLEAFVTRTPQVFFRVDRVKDTAASPRLRPGDRLARVCFVSPAYRFYVVSDLLRFRHKHVLEIWRDGVPVEVAVGFGELKDLDGAVELRDAFPLPCEDANDCGVTPLEAIALPCGSYVAVLAAKEDMPDVRLPFVIRRGATTACTVRFRDADEIGEGFIYVPGSRAPIGGDPGAVDPLAAAEVAIDDLAIARNEVTFGEYMEYVTDCVTRDPDQFAAIVPRLFGSSGAPMWKYEKNAIQLDPSFIPPSSGVTVAVLRPMPLYGVTPAQALRYCEWLTEREGDGRVRFDLPTEEEWEHAGRGADGRRFPWGDGFDWQFTRGVYSTARSVELQKGVTIQDVAPVPVGCTPTDESPYGVRDLAGDIREICRSSRSSTGFVLRGGFWNSRGEPMFHLASREEFLAGDIASESTGFRVVRRFVEQ